MRTSGRSSSGAHGEVHSAVSIPAFGVPYANADEANHAPNENLEVERFFAGIRTGAAMLAYLGVEG